MTFVAQLLSPALIVACLIGGAVSRRWWHLFVVAVIGSLLHEAVMQTLQSGRSVRPVELVLGTAAGLVWAAVAFKIQRWRAKQQAGT